MTVTLTRADTVIAMRNAHRDAAKRRAAFPGFPLEPGVWAMMLREAFRQIREMKIQAERDAARAAYCYVEYDAKNGRPAGRWYGPEHLLDMRDAAELEVLRWEMADVFTATGNSRLFEAKGRLAEIEAQLTWRAVA